MKTLFTLFAGLLFTVQVLAATGAKATATITGMTCQGCAENITEALKKLPEVDVVKINVKTGKSTITAKNGSTLDEAKIKTAVEGAGYKVKSISLK